jgi:ribonucleotide reductase beta subunit family protein with ferritin-like domain
MQQTVDFLFHNHDVYAPEPSIGQKREWIQKWTKSKHPTFAKWFVAFTAATLIFDTINFCAIEAFENAKVLRGLVEGIHLANKHTEVLEDFCNFVHNNLLIRAASPFSICDIVRDAADYEFNYAKAIVAPENDDFLDCNLLIKNIKKNADKTLRILGQPPYFHVPTV